MTHPAHRILCVDSSPRRLHDLTELRGVQRGAHVVLLAAAAVYSLATPWLPRRGWRSSPDGRGPSSRAAPLR